MTRSWLAALFVTASATLAPAQTAPAPAPTLAVKADLLPTPRLRIGRAFSIELVAKVQGDVSRFDPVIDADDEHFDRFDDLRVAAVEPPEGYCGEEIRSATRHEPAETAVILPSVFRANPSRRLPSSRMKRS